MEGTSAVTLPLPWVRPSTPERELTLGECYERYLLPDHQAGSERTISGTRTALKHWARITGDPPIAAIDDATLRKFRDGLVADGKKGSTVRSICAHLSPIFHRLGPRDWRNKRGADVLEHVLFFDLSKIPATRTRKRIARPEQLAAVYEAATEAYYPHHGARTLAWRTVFTLLATYGQRYAELFKSRRSSGLLWSHVHFEPECPEPEFELTNPYGWIEFVPPKNRWRKPEPLLLPISRAVRAHLDALQAVSASVRMTCGRGFGERVIPFNGSTREHREQRDFLWQKAGCGKGFTFQDLRKTCRTAWEKHCPGLGDYVTGHAPRGVSGTFYVEKLGLVVEAIERYSEAALPACYHELPTAGVQHVQRRLFA